MLLINEIDESIFNKLNIIKKPLEELTDMSRIKLALEIFGTTVLDDLKCIPSNDLISSVLELDPNRIVRRLAYDKKKKNKFDGDMEKCRYTFSIELKSAFYDKKKKKYYAHRNNLFKFKMNHDCDSKYLFVYSPRTYLSKQEIEVLENIVLKWNHWLKPSDEFNSKFKQSNPNKLQVMIPNTDNDYTFRVLKGKVYQIDPSKEYKIIDDVLCHYSPVIPVKAVEQ